jgi:hypothetical protein
VFNTVSKADAGFVAPPSAYPMVVGTAVRNRLLIYCVYCPAWRRTITQAATAKSLPRRAARYPAAVPDGRARPRLRKAAKMTPPRPLKSRPLPSPAATRTPRIRLCRPRPLARSHRSGNPAGAAGSRTAGGRTPRCLSVDFRGGFGWLLHRTAAHGRFRAKSLDPCRGGLIVGQYRIENTYMTVLGRAGGTGEAAVTDVRIVLGLTSIPPMVDGDDRSLLSSCAWDRKIDACGEPWYRAGAPRKESYFGGCRS